MRSSKKVSKEQNAHAAIVLIIDVQMMHCSRENVAKSQQSPGN